MEKIPTAPELEQETLPEVSGQMPAELTLTKVQQDRCYLDGGWVVASGSILAPEGSVVAIKPFLKSKTGFTIEFCFYRSRPATPPCSIIPSEDHRTKTVRLTFVGWKDGPALMKPYHLANYRGKKVMGLIGESWSATRPVYGCTSTLFSSHPRCRVSSRANRTYKEKARPVVRTGFLLQNAFFRTKFATQGRRQMAGRARAATRA